MAEQGRHCSRGHAEDMVATWNTREIFLIHPLSKFQYLLLLLHSLEQWSSNFSLY